MASFRRTPVVVVWFLCICIHVIGDPDTTVVHKICNGIKTGFGTVFDDRMNTVTEDLVQKTQDNGFNYYEQLVGVDGEGCYGHAACYGALSHHDCFTCLISARSELTGGCPQNTGAQVQLQDCRMRYEDYPFTEPP